MLMTFYTLETALNELTKKPEVSILCVGKNTFKRCDTLADVKEFYENGDVKPVKVEVKKKK